MLQNEIKLITYDDDDNYRSIVCMRNTMHATTNHNV